MQLSRALKAFVLGLSAISVAEATFIKVDAGRHGAAIQRRQDDDESVTSKPAVTSTSAPPAETTTSPPAAETTTTSEETKPTSTSPPPETTSKTTTQNAPTSKPTTTEAAPPSTTDAAPESSTTEAPSSSSAVDNNDSSSSEQQSTIVQTITKVFTSTAPDGSQMTLTSETVTTATAGLAGGNSGGSQDSGMSTQTRNTVIGVVVGVGGAIILGGLALVAWRIWGRKKQSEENDGLMDYGSTAEKPESGGSMAGRTPFQSTLESYHAPTPNTAANF